MDKRYIEANALKDVIDNPQIMEYEYGHIWAEQVLQVIDQQPTADVQEKKCSLWIDKPHIAPQKNTLYPVVECAECGFDFADIINNHKTIYRYCPWCGAIMGGKKNNMNDKGQE